MAEIPNSEDFKNLNIEGAEFVDMLQQMNAAMRQLNAEMSRVTGEQSRHVNTTTKAVNLAKELSGYSADDLANAKTRRRFETIREKTLKEQRSLAGKIGAEHKKLNNLSGQEKKLQLAKIENLRDQLDQSKALVERTDEIIEAQKELNKRTKFFDDLQEIVEDIPILRKFFPEFKKAAEAAQAAAAKGESAFAAAAGSIAKAGSKLATAFTVDLFVKGILAADKAAVNFQRSLNLTSTQAQKFTSSLNSNLLFTVDQLAKTNAAINQVAGTAVAMNTSELEAIATLTERMGVTADTAGSLYSFAAATGKEFQGFNEELIATVALQNQLSGTSIDYKQVMSDVAEAGAAARLSMEQFPGGIVKAAFQARKLGLNLAALEKSAGSLLDFESSIEAELEAELLTGQELNLERARAFALTNDMAGVASELAAQGITQEKFAKMNRLAQEATAQAMGMSREEMAQMFEKQNLVAKLSESDLNTKQKMQVLMESGMSMAEAAAQLGEDEFKMRKEQMTLDEQREKLQDRLIHAANRFLDMLEPLKGIFTFLIEKADSLYKILLMIAAIRIGRGIAGMGKQLANATKSATQLSTATQVAAKGTDAAATAAKTGQQAAGAIPAGTKLNSAGKLIDAKTGKFVPKPAAPPVAQGGGGMFSKAFDATKSFLGKGAEAVGKMGAKLNPATAILQKAGGWIAKNIGKVLKFPVISSILEGIFAKGDIEALISTATNKDDLYQSVGKRAFEAIGSVGGSLGGGLLGSLIPIPGVGTALGALGGDFAGRWLGGIFADNFGASGMGKFIVDDLFPEAKAAANAANPELGLATGGIVVEPTRALVGEAGAEAVVPLKEFYAKFDELISVVKQGGNVYIDGNKAGQALALGTNRLR